MAAYERHQILRALEATGGAVRAAAPLLGLPERSLWRRCQALGIEPARVRATHILRSSENP
jgi:DNA-binding NtrC family response regulator